MADPRELNRQFTDDALECAGLADNKEHSAYHARRLAEGAEEYGEFQFREANCAAEAAEEAIDGANWAGFEFVKRVEAGTVDKDCERLNRAAVHFALAYAELDEYLAGRPPG